MHSDEHGWRALRHHDPALERLDSGFSLLLDAYAMVDHAVAQQLARQVALQGAACPPACAAGCCVCCRQPIPLTPLEALAARVHVRLHRPAGMLSHVPDIAAPCPLLTKQDICAAYAVRPVACRQYIVFGAPCRVGEDATQSRPQDVFTPDYVAMHAALRHTLPWYANWPGYPDVDAPQAGLDFLRKHTNALQLLWQGHKDQ